MAASSTEVNDLLVRLSACAHSVRGPVGDELMHLVSRLTNAVTRERTNGFSELQSLRRKILQHSDVRRRPEIPHRQTPPVKNTAMVPRQTAMVPNSNYGHFSQDRLNAVLHGPPSSPVRKPGFLVTQPTASNAVPVVPREQRRETTSPTGAPMQQVQQDSDARGWLLNGPNATKARKRTASVTSEPASKKPKPEENPPTYSSRLVNKESRPVFLHDAPACAKCVAERQKCGGPSSVFSAGCSNCHNADCIFLPCKPATCVRKGCPRVHEGQGRTPRGHPACRILGINIGRGQLCHATLKTIQKAYDEISMLGNHSQPNPSARPLAMAMQKQPLAVDLPPSQDVPTGAKPHVESQMWLHRSFDFNGTNTRVEASKQQPAAAAKTRDPRLVARGMFPSKANDAHRAAPVQAQQKQIEPLVKSRSQPQGALKHRSASEMDRVAEPSAVLASRATFGVVSQLGPAGEASGRLRMSSQPAVRGPTVSLVEQQRSIEELLQSLMPVTNEPGNASEQQARTASRPPNVGGSSIQSTAGAAPFAEAVPALQAASLTSNGAVKIGGDDGGLEDGEIEEPRTAQELKAEQSEVAIKIEVDE